MFSRLLLVMASVSFLGSTAAFAEGRCVLSRLESIDSNRSKETLIISDLLDVSDSSRGERLWVSNDGTVKLRIQRAFSSAGRSELRISVAVNDVTILRSTGQATGDFVGTQAAASAPDGRAFSFTCFARSTN